jgi:class 3 adenylate cyclase
VLHAGRRTNSFWRANGLKGLTPIRRFYGSLQAENTERDDIYGHGVNVAARLESLAPPGSICISADAWRYVRGAIAAEFVDPGELQLKNIADPAHVFAISPAA